MTRLPKGTILVGIDGSPPSDAALTWALDEAGLRGRPVHLVHARGEVGWWPRAEPPHRPDTADTRDGVLAESMRYARQHAPQLKVTCSTADTVAAAAILERSADAELIVLGGRSGDTVRSILLGSVSRQVAAHSACPVVVVHDESYRSRDTSGIAVGIDGSTGSMQALEFSFARAAERHLALTVVHAWWLGQPSRPPVGAEETAGTVQQLLTEATAPLRKQYPDVDVHERLVHSQAVDALVDASAAAQLLVIGSRGAGGFRGLLLGSVSHRVLQHALCPVAVLHPQRSS